MCLISNFQTMDGFKLMVAPIQGITERAFRYFHDRIYGNGSGDVVYFSPFIRMERGEVRQRDMRELTAPENAGMNFIPQIIFRNVDEFITLANTVRDAGCGSVDLNMGCPFIPQVRKGRGAGLIGKTDILESIADVMHSMSDMRFSIKMRLGVENAGEWRSSAGVINKMPLEHVVLHARTAVQQYRGELNYDEAKAFVSEIEHPVVFNGDIDTPEKIDYIREIFEGIGGVMIGRGLLRRPSIMAEWLSGEEWSVDKRRECVIELHDSILAHYESALTGGEKQILSKIQPVWEYFGTDFDRKYVKKILKAGNMVNYKTAVRDLI